MNDSFYHYTECGLNNIYLVNGYQFIDTPRGKAVSINNTDGLHKAIGLFLVTNIKDLTGAELSFLRHEMLMSQKTLAELLGMNEQAINRWGNGKRIPGLLRFCEFVSNIFSCDKSRSWKPRMMMAKCCLKTQPKDGSLQHSSKLSLPNGCLRDAPLEFAGMFSDEKWHIKMAQ